MNEVLAVLDDPTLRVALTVLFAMVLVGVLVRAAKRLLRARIDDSALRYRAGKLASVLGYAVILVVLVSQVAGRFSGFTVAIGAASAGIAFALQEVIASFAGWLGVALGGYYNVGDRVQLGGITGDVIDIGFLRTTIMECGGWVDGDLYNGRIVRVANSFVFKEPVFNYSGEFPFLWDELVVPIKYGSDYELSRQILLETAAAIVGEYATLARSRWKELVRSYRIEDARVEPLVTLSANDNWAAFTLRYVVDHRSRRTTKDALFRRILKEVEASGGRVALASTTVQLVDVPALRVSLERPPASPRDGGGAA